VGRGIEDLTALPGLRAAHDGDAKHDSTNRPHFVLLDLGTDGDAHRTPFEGYRKID